MYTQYFIIRGEYLANTLRGPLRVREELCAPYGRAFWCPLCAEVWALCPVDGQAVSVTLAPCDKHHPGDSVGTWSFGRIYPWEHPGSLWRAEDDDWNRNLPLEVLRREFLLLMHERDTLGLTNSPI